MLAQLTERMAEIAEELLIVEGIISDGAREGDHCLSEREYRWHLIEERNDIQRQIDEILKIKR